MKKQVWLTRSPEWVKANPGKGTLYKATIDTTEGQVPDNATKELRDEIKKQRVSTVSGVYVIKCETLKTAYIGQSINMDSRLRQHKLLLQRPTRNTKIIAYKQMYKDIDAVGIEAFEFLKFRTGFTNDVDILLQQESEVIQQFILKGYTLYNTSVALTKDYIYCPLEYQEQVKKIIAELLSS